MSPSRTRPQFVPSRPRSEIYTAVAVAVAIVAGTALLVWLIRPGTRGIPGGGGLFNRQPRMTILVILTAILAVAAVAYLLRGRRRPKRLGTRGALAVGIVGAIVVGVVAAIFWPDGVVKHYPSQPKFSDTPPAVNPVSTVPPTVTPTTAAGKGSSTTVKTGSTSTPATASTPTTKAR